MNKVPRAFIIHASADKERFALGFATSLRQAGVDAWLSEWEIASGDNLISRIFDEGLGQADTVVIILSKLSVDRPWVRAELDIAKVRQIEELTRLIPVVLEDCKVPMPLRDTKWVRIKSPGSYDAELRRIVADIYGMSDKPPLGTPPAYATAGIVTAPGLTKMESIILKLLGDIAMEKGNTLDIRPEVLKTEADALDLPEDEVGDALSILASEGYLNPAYSYSEVSYPIAYPMTQYGFEEYAKAYVTGYEHIKTDVISRLVNHGDDDSNKIIAALGEPKILIQHILLSMSQMSEINQRYIGIDGAWAALNKDNPLYIMGISPALKRLLR